MNISRQQMYLTADQWSYQSTQKQPQSQLPPSFGPTQNQNNKTLQTKRQSLPPPRLTGRRNKHQIDTQMMQRMNNLAKRSMAYEESTRQKAESVIMDDLKYRYGSDGEVSGQEQSGWTVVHPIIKTQQRFLSFKDTNLDNEQRVSGAGGLPMHQTSYNRSFQTTMSPDLNLTSGGITAPATISFLNNTQQFSPAPFRSSAMPELTQGVLDTIINSPKIKQSKVRNIIMKHMSGSNSNLSRTSRHQQSSSFRASSTTRPFQMPKLSSPTLNKMSGVSFLSPTNSSKGIHKKSANEQAFEEFRLLKKEYVKNHNEFKVYNSVRQEEKHTSRSTVPKQLPLQPNDTPQFNIASPKAQNQKPTSLQPSPKQSSMKSPVQPNLSVTLKAASSRNVAAKEEQKKKKAALRPDGKKKQSMTQLIGKVGKLVNMKQNSMLKNVVLPGAARPDSSSDEKTSESNASDDSLMEQALITMKLPTVDQLMKEYKHNFEEEKKEQKRKKGEPMKIKSDKGRVKEVTFVENMPDKSTLRKTHKDVINEQKEKILRDVAQDRVHLQGNLQVNEIHDRYEKVRTSAIDQVETYAKNFSEVADLADLDRLESQSVSAMQIFANAIRNNAMTNLVKVKIQTGLHANLEKKREKREKDEETLPRHKDRQQKLQSLFQRASTNENNAVQSKANDFIQRMKYYEQFKKRDMDEDNKTRDPAVKYFKKCQEEKTLLLPIFEKIYQKTLCLQNYILDDGQCHGIAEACQFIDHKHMNRVLFNNCGLTGNKFATILEGLALVKDFKSIIYKHNELNALAIAKLQPLLEKNIPNQLSELILIDCRIHCVQLEQLLTMMIDRNQLQKFALVNVNHNDSSFALLCNFVENGFRLRDLNLSWQCKQPKDFMQLLQIVKNNRHLVNLNLSFNKLLLNQPTMLTMKQIQRGLSEVPLTQQNQEILNCLTQFIKYNTYLVHLDLTSCGLIEPALKELTSFLTKSQALQVLHLSGNDGITQSTIGWIQQRIRGHIRDADKVVAPFSKEFQYKQFEESPTKSSPMKGGLIKLLRKQGTLEMQDKKATELMWRDIRQGLKLMNMVQSKRINEDNKIITSGKSSSKLIIQRHLGFKDLLPNSGRWKICVEENNECWYCGQHILTLFIWTQRISMLSEVKDPDFRQYYRDKVDRMTDIDPHFQPIKSGEVPHIIGPFTNWNYAPMRQIIPFCKQYDQKPPNFVQMAVNERLVNPNCIPGPDHELEEPTAAELQAIEDVTTNHYRENWSKTVLDFMRFANPHIANAQALTRLSLKQEPDQHIYFHAAWCKPGRNTYLIEQQNFKHDSREMSFLMQRDDSNSDPIKALFDSKSPTTPNRNEIDKHLMKHSSLFTREDNCLANEFYVHQMLTTFRTDFIPFYANPRHIKQVSRELHKSKNVFADKQIDDSTLNFACAEADFPAISLEHLVDADGEVKKIKKCLSINMAYIKEIYIYLQGKSTKYPYIDHYTFHKHFLKESTLPYEAADKASYDTILAAVEFSTRDIDAIPVNRLCRAKFSETIIRMARYIYMNDELVINPDNYNEYDVVTLPKALTMLMDTYIKQFYIDHEIDRLDFREDKLWQRDIDLVFSMNQSSIQEIHKMLASRNSGNKITSSFEAVTISLADCEQLIQQEMNMSVEDIERRDIRAAFATSKHVQINEIDHNSVAVYDKLTYIEFLEFIARMAEAWFSDTEMDDYPLYRKIEYFLERMFTITGAELVHQQIIIEEFSDSDDDY